MCRHAPTRHTHMRTTYPRLHAPASHARLPHRTRARIPPPFTRQQATHAATPHMRTHTASNAARASFVAQGGAHGVCPPRLLRSGCRRFQHVPPCTNATHARTATPTPSTRQRAAHACRAVQRARIPSPSRASKPRTPRSSCRFQGGAGRRPWRRVRRTAFARRDS